MANSKRQRSSSILSTAHRSALQRYFFIIFNLTSWPVTTTCTRNISRRSKLITISLGRWCLEKDSLSLLARHDKRENFRLNTGKVWVKSDPTHNKLERKEIRSLRGSKMAPVKKKEKRRERGHRRARQQQQPFYIREKPLINWNCYSNARTRNIGFVFMAITTWKMLWTARGFGLVVTSFKETNASLQKISIRIGHSGKQPNQRSVTKYFPNSSSPSLEKKTHFPLLLPT